MHRALALISAVLLTGTALAAEATRSVTAELHRDGKAPFGVENLVGEMRLVTGPGPGISVTAAVHGETDALVGQVRIEQVDVKGVPTLRVVYPQVPDSRYRYPGAERHHEGFLESFLGSSTQTDYAGARVRVSGTRGTLLYADVTVQVPAEADASFKNVVGTLSAQGLQGHLRFESAAGNVYLEQVSGEADAETGSGEIHSKRGSGTLRCHSGSGSCDVESFSGDSLVLDTGSGGARVATARVAHLVADTGSGDVTLRGIDAQDVRADAGSGDVAMETEGRRLRSVKADVGSGNITMRLDPASGFHLRASAGSGDVRCLFEDAKAIKEDRKVVGYDRGDESLNIAVDAGSGDVTVAPLGGKTP
jgi:hypothetical protein